MASRAAWMYTGRLAGFKLWANFGQGEGVHKNMSTPSADYIYDMENGELLAIVHSNRIGRYRTSAGSSTWVSCCAAIPGPLSLTVMLRPSRCSSTSTCTSHA